MKTAKKQLSILDAIELRNKIADGKYVEGNKGKLELVDRKEDPREAVPNIKMKELEKADAAVKKAFATAREIERGQVVGKNVDGTPMIISLNESPCGQGFKAGVLSRDQFTASHNFYAEHKAGWGADVPSGYGRDSCDGSVRGGAGDPSAEYLKDWSDRVKAHKQIYSDAKQAIVDSVKSTTYRQQLEKRDKVLTALAMRGKDARLSDKKRDKAKADYQAHIDVITIKASLEAHATAQVVVDHAIDLMSVGDWRDTYKHVQRLRDGLQAVHEHFTQGKKRR